MDEGDAEIIKEELESPIEFKVKFENLSNIVRDSINTPNEDFASNSVYEDQDDSSQTSQFPVIEEEIQNATDITIKLEHNLPYEKFDSESESEYNFEDESESGTDSDTSYQIPRSFTPENRTDSQKRKDQIKTFQCPLCPQIFQDIPPLITHVRSEHAKNENLSSKPQDEEDSLQCPLCPKSLKTLPGLWSHFSQVHLKSQTHVIPASEYGNHKDIPIKKNYKCEHCPNAFKYKQSMLRHIIKNHKEHCDKFETFKCEFCDGLFCSTDDLGRHVVQTHVADTFDCTICPRKFLEEEELNKHVENHRKDNIRFKCDVCFKTSTADTIMLHLKRQHQRYFRCRVCFSSFFSKEEFLSHSISIETAEKLQLQCKICLVFFNTQCSLNIHKKSHDTSSESELVKSTDITNLVYCDFCPESFAQKSLLLEHAMKIHPNHKWNCESCEKSFRLKQQLRIHEMQHSAHKIYKCSQCPKSYRAEFNLQRHEDSHKNKEDRKYKCSLCSESFALSAAIKLHMTRVHGAEKSFKCHICSKAFALKHYLDLHLVSHSNERPFGCDQCPGFFKCFKHLRNHQRKIHGDKRRVIGDRVRHGPESKYYENLIFVCSVNECKFETKDEKEVAIHYAKHDLPKLNVKRSLPSSWSEESLSKPGGKIRRMIETRYKCLFCPKVYPLTGSLRGHLKAAHEGKANIKLEYLKQYRVNPGPKSKYNENLVYVCTEDECDLETKDRKEVAIHNAMHGLPKLILPRCLSSSAEVLPSKSSLTIKRTIQTRFKCKECFALLREPVGLLHHMRKCHGQGQGGKKVKKKKKSKHVVPSSDEDEM